MAATFAQRSGQDVPNRHGSNGTFYRGSQAAALVYDVTIPESFERLAGWREEIVKVVPNQKCIVIGNKINLARIQDAGIAEHFARGIQAPYLETSSLTGQGVQEVFLALARQATAD